MQLRTELAATVAGFVALNLLLVFTAIGLFVRMGPAIERILLRNDATIAAAEEVLEILAESGGRPLSTEERSRVDGALDRARDNVTEAGETPALERIAATLEAAATGDADARLELVAGLRELIDVNRRAMRDVDREAQRLGRAGAWVGAFVGLASLALSLFLTRSLGRRVVRPIQELRDTLAAARTGDRFRRCTARSATPDLAAALADVNDLLDARMPTGDDRSGPEAP